VAERHHQTPAQVAINWMRAKPFVSAPIIGANTVAQLHDTMAGLDHPLPAEDVQKLDDVSDFYRSRATLEE